MRSKYCREYFEEYEPLDEEVWYDPYNISWVSRKKPVRIRNIDDDPRYYPEVDVIKSWDGGK